MAILSVYLNEQGLLSMYYLRSAITGKLELAFALRVVVMDTTKAYIIYPSSNPS